MFLESRQVRIVAVFDSNIGIINIFREYNFQLNYYVDNKFSSYGVYRHEEIAKRVLKIYEALKDEKRIIISDLDAAGILDQKENVFYGLESMKKFMTDKKILMLTSRNLSANNFLRGKISADFRTLDSTYLINACLSLADNFTVGKILDEYLENISLNSYDLIFFGASPFGLYKSFFMEKLKAHKILTNIDPILCDFSYIKENILRDYFFTSGDKRFFYFLAEDYLRREGRLKKEEILNISSWNM